MNEQFSLGGRLWSFTYAWRGIQVMLRTQHNAWIHAAVTLLVCLTGTLIPITRADWCWVVLAIMAVWTAEALNTSLELLCDVAAPDFHPLVERSKDVAAGSVLLSSVGALVIGLFIFVPHIAAWWAV